MPLNKRTRIPVRRLIPARVRKIPAPVKRTPVRLLILVHRLIPAPAREIPARGANWAQPDIVIIVKGHFATAMWWQNAFTGSRGVKHSVRWAVPTLRGIVVLDIKPV